MRRRTKIILFIFICIAFVSFCFLYVENSDDIIDFLSKDRLLLYDDTYLSEETLSQFDNDIFLLKDFNKDNIRKSDTIIFSNSNLRLLSMEKLQYLTENQIRLIILSEDKISEHVMYGLSIDTECEATQVHNIACEAAMDNPKADDKCLGYYSVTYKKQKPVLTEYSFALDKLTYEKETEVILDVLNSNINDIFSRLSFIN